MNRLLRPSLLLVIFAFLLAGSVWMPPRTFLQGGQPSTSDKPAAKSTEAPGAVDFVKQVAPLFVERCVSCHNASQRKGQLDLSSGKSARAGGDSGPAIVPHQPDKSVLLEFVTPGANGSKPAMPQKGEPLSASQLALLKRWIAEGARWPDELVLREKSKADASWWSLQPLKVVDPAVTPGMPEAWQRSPIDRFVYARLAENGLTPSPRADRRTLIRRVTYDLIGLPPTPAEVAAFEADTRPDAYAQLIDRLLASPHYGEHWGRHWLDVARFGESTGFERNVIIDNAWPYRDYVIQSFNEDKPFHRFVHEQLAGDVLALDDPDADVGTAFLVAGPYDNVGNQDAVQRAQIQANTIDEILTAAGTAFLGLTVNCARCHDHKFDPVTQADYYRLFAVFSGVSHADRVVATRKQRQEYNTQAQPLLTRKDQLTKEKTSLEQVALEQAEKNPLLKNRNFKLPAVNLFLTTDQFPPVEAQFVRLTATSTDRTPLTAKGARIDEFEVFTAEETPRNVALAANGGTATALSRVAEDFQDAYAPKLAIDGKFGQSWICDSDVAQLTIRFQQPQTINRVVFSSDRLKASPGPSQVNVFIGEYQLEVSRDGKTWTKVADSLDRPPLSDAFRRERVLRHGLSAADRQKLADLTRDLEQVEQQLKAIPPLPRVWAGRFTQPPAPAYVMLGGDPQKRGPVVTAGSLDVLQSTTKKFELKADAPEWERRLALAMWLTQPDQPLTPRVWANRVWHYHFGTGIVDTPSDFGYQGGRPSHPELLDWLAQRVHTHGWKLKPLHRDILLSETYQQSSTFRQNAADVDASSRLLWRFPPRRLSAEEVRDSLLSLSGQLDTRPGGPGFRLYRYLQDNVATYVPLDQVGPETYRRSVYHQYARASRVDVLSDFDCPDNAFSTPARASTTTPLQALTLLNHTFTHHMARHLANRVSQDAGPQDIAPQIRRLFALAYSRSPTAQELQSATTLVQQHGLITLCRAVLNSNELIYLE